MYHARAASLMWVVEKAAAHRHVESIIAEALTSSDAMDKEASYHAFGALWRLTGSLFSHVNMLAAVF
jgi:hypothetical protein